jgi:hypothetical protein
MVYFDPSDLGCTPYIRQWLTTLPKDFPLSCQQLLNELLDFSLEKGFKFLNDHKPSLYFQLNKYNIIQSLCAIISGFLEFFHTHGGFNESSENTSRGGKSSL